MHKISLKIAINIFTKKYLITNWPLHASGLLMWQVKVEQKLEYEILNNFWRKYVPKKCF